MHEEHSLEVGPPDFDLTREGPVPFPGVPGAAIPRAFTVPVRDPANCCVVQMEVEVTSVGARLRSFAVRAEGDPLTPTSLRRLPIGSYLDAAVTRAVMRMDAFVDTGGENRYLVTPIAELDQAVKVMNAGKAARRRRQPVTTDRLAAVASAYREGPDRGKSEYVAEQLGVESGYARQLIHRARKAGLLSGKDT